VTQLDHLDTLAARLVGTTDASGWGPLSTGERLYVALAAGQGCRAAGLRPFTPAPPPGSVVGFHRRQGVGPRPFGARRLRRLRSAAASGPCAARSP